MFSVLVCCLFFSVPAVSFAYTETREILSNEMWGVDGKGDTVWLATSRGLNYTVNATDTSGGVSWRGFEGIKAWPVAFGEGRMTACGGDEDDRSADFWVFDHNEGESAALEKISVRFGSDDEITAEDTVFSIYSRDVVWSEGAFWASCFDAGLLRVDTDVEFSQQSITNNASVYIPGDSSVYTVKSLPIENFSQGLKDNSVNAVSVDDSGVVWAACSKSVWRLDPDDTSWTRIAGKKIDASLSGGDSVSIGTYYDILAVSSDSGEKIYVQAVNENDSSVSVYRYSDLTQEWRKFINASQDAEIFEKGAAGRVYTVFENKLLLFRDTLSASGLPLDIESAEISGSAFQKDRFPSSLQSPRIYDLHYDISQGDTLFWIATSKGLFCSFDEHADEREGELFLRIFREKKLAAGLEKVYAYPGILNESGQSAVFAYNLKDDDRVSIDIYDFNMDHVVNIIDNEKRFAGRNRKDGSGRSTDEKRDFWDGTFENNGGEAVAPGLYYFKISTNKGKRAFGKIVVAKPR